MGADHCRKDPHQFNQGREFCYSLSIACVGEQSFFAKYGRTTKVRTIAEYAVMLAVILVIVVGTIKLVGTQANTSCSTTQVISLVGNFEMTPMGSLLL